MGPYSAMCRLISMTNSALRSPNSLLHEKHSFIRNCIFKKYFSKYFEKRHPQICEILDSEIPNLSMTLFPKIYLLN